MQTLKDINRVPPILTATEPDSFRYTHPETGFTTKAMDYMTWIDRARKHLLGNGIPVPDDLERKMQDQLCQQLSPDWCEQDQSNRVWVNTNLAFEDVKNWAISVIARFTSGEKLVEQDEANRRARICANCYLNVNTGGCAGCGKLVQLLTPGMNERKTPYDDSLKACAVCKCYNRVQTSFPLSILEETDTPERQAQYPSEFCWKSKVSPNYVK